MQGYLRQVGGRLQLHPQVYRGQGLDRRWETGILTDNHPRVRQQLGPWGLQSQTAARDHLDRRKLRSTRYGAGRRAHWEEVGLDRDEVVREVGQHNSMPWTLGRRRHSGTQRCCRGLLLLLLVPVFPEPALPLVRGKNPAGLHPDG